MPKQPGVWRVILARLEFIDTLMDKHGSTPENGLSLQAVSPMVTVGLNSSNNLTRAKATTILKRLHELHGHQKVLPLIRGIESDASRRQTQELLGPPPAAPPPPPAPGKKAPPPAGRKPVAPSPAKQKSPVAKKGAPGGAAAAKKSPAGAGPSVADREPTDEKEKVVWYEKRAMGGDADAQYNLGCCFDEGRGVKS
ncbi:hypothetical protein T484DRAFT_1772830, partial [Baffinella frigidus]